MAAEADVKPQPQRTPAGMADRGDCAASWVNKNSTEAANVSGDQQGRRALRESHGDP